MIRHFLLIAAFSAVSSPALAQEEATLVAGDFHSGGFGAPVVKFSDVGGDFAVFVGGRGGWIINHTFVLGGGGYGLASNLGEFPFEREIEFGYGGLELEYINRSNKVVHFSIYTLIGGGGVVLLFDRTDSVFVLEPAINLMFNVTKFFRIGAGGGYRLVAGADQDLSNGDLSAPVGVLTLKFGSF